MAFDFSLPKELIDIYNFYPQNKHKIAHYFTITPIQLQLIKINIYLSKSDHFIKVPLLILFYDHFLNVFFM